MNRVIKTDTLANTVRSLAPLYYDIFVPGSMIDMARKEAQGKPAYEKVAYYTTAVALETLRLAEYAMATSMHDILMR